MMKHYALMLALSFACLIGHSIGGPLAKIAITEESWKSAAVFSKEDHPAGYNLWKNTRKIKITNPKNGQMTFQHQENLPSKATFRWQPFRTHTLANDSDHPIQFLLQHVKTKDFLYWPWIPEGQVQTLQIPQKYQSSGHGAFSLYIAESPSDVWTAPREIQPIPSSQASSSAS
ncbi:hypothetical protein PGTUg99_020380 [Puccinia graminis f. sp. tritici]|uniref:Uncharacterized protein n=1 Tax=Puccinia graminis f. sp. tritici TaxID=56615 RepID=A0A5B0RCV2_PUCGR|nr:hypothetical protein PGTUg99_020380 [Puccinia graminis f. sp. tritici]